MKPESGGEWSYHNAKSPLWILTRFFSSTVQVCSDRAGHWHRTTDDGCGQ